MTDAERKSRAADVQRRLRSVAAVLGRRMPRPEPPRRVVALRFDASPGAVPSSCACCGANASESLREERPGSMATVIIPYCTECHFHASSVGTRRLAVALSSVLVAMTLTAAVPLLGLSLGTAAYVLSIALGSSLPVAIGAVSWHAPRAGHSARGRAVWWQRDGALVCTHARWAEALASMSSARLVHRRTREPLLSALAFLGVAFGTLFSPLVYRLGHPPVRVLNLTPTEITILSDGRPVATLPPTSQESTHAGTTVRLLMGKRQLRAVDRSGAVLDDRKGQVTVGREHLYAPGAEGICFWLERTSYGRVKDPAVDRTIQALGHGSGFWALGPAVDTWFAPNPGSNADERSTGGELTALRQAPCLEAPGSVRDGALSRPAFAAPNE